MDFYQCCKIIATKPNQHLGQHNYIPRMTDFFLLKFFTGSNKINSKKWTKSGVVLNKMDDWNSGPDLLYRVSSSKLLNYDGLTIPKQRWENGVQTKEYPPRYTSIVMVGNYLDENPKLATQF